MSVKKLKREIARLENVWNHPEILSLRDRILEERREQIDSLKNQIEKLRKKSSAKKPRIPDNVPQSVLETCEKFWQGTAEYDTFRIHVWNEKAVWTSYPSGGYTSNAGWNPTQACFYLISLTDVVSFGGKRPKVLRKLVGRNSSKKLLEVLEYETQ